MGNLTGAWKLVGARAFDEAGREVPSPLGPEPMGLLLVEAERMMVMVGDGCATVAPGPPSRAFLAYTGNYQFDGKVAVTRVDGASRSNALADQVRQISFQGPDRMVIVPLSPVLGRKSGLELTWERLG